MPCARSWLVSLALLALICGCSDSAGSDPPATTVAPATTTSLPPPTTRPQTTTAGVSTTTTTTAPTKVFPEGTLVAFSSDRAGTGALFVVDTADGEVRQIGFGLETMISPAWSPDGRSIVYVSLSGRSRLAIVDVAAAWDGSSDPVELTDGTLEVDSPTWSSDGTIAFQVTTGQGDSEVWTIPAAGGEPELLLANAAGPAYSPDGTQLAFVALGDRESAIAVLDSVSGDVTVLTDPADRATTPAWSPDGSQIAFTAGTRDYDVWIVDVTSGEVRLLAGDPVREWWPCWTGGGEVVYALFAADGLHDIWVTDPVAGGATPLIESPSDDWFPACQPLG